MTLEVTKGLEITADAKPTLRRGQPCRLSDQQARDLARRWADGEGTGDLGKEYDLSRQGVLNIIKRVIREKVTP